MTGQAVVLVHGLWVNGMDMALLRHRLRPHFSPFQFSYHSVCASPGENAARLAEFSDGIDAETLHYVAHSLGGLVVRHLFHRTGDRRPGRVVTLGTPHRPSHSARRLHGFAPTRALLGKSTEHGLLGGVPPWREGRELGSIAGTRRFGMGVVIPGLPVPNDGTVAVEETRLEGLRDHLTLPLSHFGLLFSSLAGDAVVNFLQHGRFTP